MVEKRGEPAYLTKIDINLPEINAKALTDVSFTFYFPRTRKQLSVGYVNTDLSISTEQMEMARRARVADVMIKAQDAALAPQFSERAPPEHVFVPTPLLSSRIGLREAYQVARQGGLIRADHIDLKMNTKNPNAPLLIWSFTGTYTGRSDAQAIHVDALTGALIDEDRINTLTRAERNEQLQGALTALKTLVSRSSSSAGSASGYGGPGTTTTDNGSQACGNRFGTMRYGNCQVYQGGSDVHIDPSTGKEISQ
jgi:hypothetical protein